MFLQVVFLVALLTFGECQNENECVREIRSLKSDLQVELRSVVRKEIAVQSVSREEVEELVEDKATKVSIETLQQNLTAQNTALQDTIIETISILNSSINPGDQCVTRDEIRNIIQSEVESVVQNQLQSIVAQVKCNNTGLFTNNITPEPEPDQNPATYISCSNIHQGKPSGVYWIQGANGSASQQYCDMTRTCCGTTGGWMKVANLDMKDTNQQCPSGLTLITSPRRSCGRRSPPGCVSTTFRVHGVEYSRVCGKIIGYQYASTDAFSGGNINGPYVDGASLTHGTSPRKHIWTFASALDETRIGSMCPCTCFNPACMGRVPSFVGQDFFCDTGSRNTFTHIFYSGNPLWDGQGCGSRSACCSFNNPPWFCKELQQPTRDDIELRLCGTEGIHELSEDTPLEVVEIYVH